MEEEKKKRIQEFFEGLTLLAKYDRKGYGVQAEHDEVFVTIDEVPSDEDIVELRILGWSPEDRTFKWWSKST